MQTTSCSTVRRAPGGRAVASAARPAASAVSAVRQAAAAAAAAALLLSSTPAFAVPPPPPKDAASAALAEQLKVRRSVSVQVELDGLSALLQRAWPRKHGAESAAAHHVCCGATWRGSAARGAVCATHGGRVCQSRSHVRGRRPSPSVLPAATTPGADPSPLLALPQASLKISDKKSKNLASVFELPKPDKDVMLGKKKPEASSGNGFSFPSFSFGTEASSSKPAVAPGPVEPSEGPSPLLLAALVLFSPLLIVQAVQLQTLARVASQALGLAQAAEPTGTVKRVVRR